MNFNDLDGIIKQAQYELEQIGLKDATMYMDQDFRGGRTFTVLFRENVTMFDNPRDAITKICEPFYENLANSPYIARIEARHQEEMQDLKEEVKRLQEANTKLSEGLSNGTEYLEMHCDGVKVVKND